jgi:hypothetical protein
MTPTREELVALMSDLPVDDEMLPTFMERLKEKHPDFYKTLMKTVDKNLKELGV